MATNDNNLANRDLAMIQHPIRLYSSKDLGEITDLARTGNVRGD